MLSERAFHPQFKSQCSFQYFTIFLTITPVRRLGPEIVFSHTHVQGTGGVDLGDILLMPVVEGRNWSWDTAVPEDQVEAQINALGVKSGWVFSASEPGYRSFFSHQREVVRAGYYSVHLKTSDVQAELTATTRCGMQRYRCPTLPAQTRQGVVVDLVHTHRQSNCGSSQDS